MSYPATPIASPRHTCAECLHNREALDDCRDALDASPARDVAVAALARLDLLTEEHTQ